MGKVVTLMDNKFVFEEVHMYKDVAYTGMFLAKKLGLPHEVVATVSTIEEGNYGGCDLKILYEKLEKGQSIKKYKYSENKDGWEAIKEYLRAEAKEIDVLVMFHPMCRRGPMAKLYKKINPNGKVYLKMDSSCVGYKVPGLIETCKRWVKQAYFYPMIMKYTDVISTERQIGYDDMIKNGFFGYQRGNYKDKIAWVPNGVAYDKNSVGHYKDKENLIITVGRIGDPGKNCEMLLSAIQKIDLLGWQVAFIGAYTEEFQQKVAEAIKQNPKLANKIVLTGNIRDRSELYGWYRRAKVFAFTSRHEGFSIALCEALTYGDYIISTDVGGASDVTKNGALGKLIAIGDESALIKHLVECVNDNAANESTYQDIIKYSQQFYWEEVIGVVADKLRKK